jgi:hypothetical protein
LNQSDLERLSRETDRKFKDCVKQFSLDMAASYVPYEKKYPELVAALNKAHRTEDFFKQVELYDKADELLKKLGVRTIWELEI